jgi:hypothetical protein
MTSANDLNAIPGSGIPVDPFAGKPGLASRIAGIGGKASSTDPSYVFRTLPLRFPAGEASFSIDFRSLEASKGVLCVEIYSMLNQIDSISTRVKITTIALRDLVKHDGFVVIHLNCQQNMLYGIAGFMEEDTDASASDLIVRANSDNAGFGIDTFSFGHENDGKLVELVAHRENTPKVRPSRVEPVLIPRLADLSMPSFAEPMSQYMTISQCAHPDYKYWVDRLGSSDDESSWGAAFVLQVLNKYDMIVDSSSCLTFDAGADRLPSFFAAMNRKVVVGVHRERYCNPSLSDSLYETKHYADLLSKDEFDAAIKVVPIEIGNPTGLEQGFDFSWSIDLVDASYFRETVYTSLKLLRPGGIGVHVVLARQDDNLDTSAVPHAELERIAVDTISYGHDVVQLRFRRPVIDKVGRTEGRPFGLIVRRA